MIPLLISFSCMGMALDFLVLWRVGHKHWRNYPYFCVSIFTSLIASIAVACVVEFHPSRYAASYWTGQFSTMITACGSIFEVLRHTFPPTIGAERFVRAIQRVLAAAAVLFGAALLLVPKAWNVNFWDFERSFRSFQAILLSILAVGIFYFGLFLRREIKAIFCGYSLYIGASLAILALQKRFWTEPYDLLWRLLQPLFYDLSLIIYILGFSFPRSSVSLTEQVGHGLPNLGEPLGFAQHVGERDFK